jgi:hypothetical protein
MKCEELVVPEEFLRGPANCSRDVERRKRHEDDRRALVDDPAGGLDQGSKPA